MKKSWCVLWASASYGPVRLMGRCILWAGKYSIHWGNKEIDCSFKICCI